MAGALPFPAAATTPYRWGAVRKLRRPDAVWSISNQDSSAEGHCQEAGHRRDQTAADDTLPSSRRLGALLSSDDYGSRVGRDVGGHPVHSDEWPRLVMRQSLWRTSRFNTSQCWADMTRWKLIVESGEEKRVNVCDAADG